ncbi:MULTISPECIES: hypothetical protein [Niveibacterium]|nr:MULTISPECIES: hypothetical protein [Niveibacterium]
MAASFVSLLGCDATPGAVRSGLTRVSALAGGLLDFAAALA